MSGVVLRCPNCGTIQSGEGQCDACHEASVRYFCNNHTPGVWLEGTSCPQCGARFGDPAPARAEPIRPAAPSADPAEFRVPSRPRATRPPETDETGPWHTEAPAEVDSSRGSAVGPDPFRILLGAMAAAARARSARTDRPDYEEVVPRRRRGGGCLGRLLMLVILLIALFLMAPVFIGALLGFN